LTRVSINLGNNAFLKMDGRVTPGHDEKNIAVQPPFISAQQNSAVVHPYPRKEL
jgi:hypothetical protein